MIVNITPLCGNCLKPAEFTIRGDEMPANRLYFQTCASEKCAASLAQQCGPNVRFAPAVEWKRINRSG